MGFGQFGNDKNMGMQPRGSYGVEGSWTNKPQPDFGPKGDVSPIDPMGGTVDPAAAAIGEDKKNSIKEYLKEIKAMQAAGQNVVPTFSNVTGSTVGQDVAGFQDAGGEQYDPSPVQNLDEFQQVDAGGINDPAAGRRLMPGENFADTPMAAEMVDPEAQAKIDKLNDGSRDGYVNSKIEEAIPLMYAELGIVAGTPMSQDQYQKFAGALSELGGESEKMYYKELDNSMAMLSSGKYDEDGIREYIEGGFKDPSLIKRVVTGDKFMIDAYKEGFKLYESYADEADEMARKYASSKRASILHLIKEGKIDEGIKESLAAGPQGGEMGGPQTSVVPQELKGQEQQAREIAQSMAQNGSSNEEIIQAVSGQFPELAQYIGRR